MTSVFTAYTNQAWPYRFRGTITVRNIAGGVPTDRKVAESWLRTKLTDNRDDLIRDMVTEVMVDRGITDVDKATAEVDKLKHLNGFKRQHCGDCPSGGGFCPNGYHPLYIEGRQLKAAVKEAASIARAVGKIQGNAKKGTGWGLTGKGLLAFVAEHIMIPEEILPLGVTEPTRVIQSFPKNPITNQTGIQYTEIVDEASFDFTVMTDWDFKEEDWAMLWLTGEQQGIGATRSQGYGRYEVTRWEPAK